MESTKAKKKKKVSEGQNKSNEEVGSIPEHEIYPCLPDRFLA
jgi:hypothetical protein